MDVAYDHGRRLDAAVFLLIMVVSFQISLSDFSCPEFCECHEVTLLTNCANISLFDEVFLNVSHLTTVLLLDSNGINSTGGVIPWKELTNLRKLTISSNNIITFESGTVSFLSKLIDLKASQNLLQEIPDEMKNLNRLKYLDLSDNEIAYIQENDLRNLTQLRRLQISNSLILISDGAFSHLSNLNSLVLSGSDFEEPLSCFQLSRWFGDPRSSQLPLVELDLSNCGISCFTNNSLIRATAIERLILNSNQILTLPHNLLYNLTMLLEINLADNHISNIPYEFFMFSRYMKRIDLQFNKITSIEPILIKKLKRLEYLDLQGNKISKPSPLDFRILRRLKELYLSENYITEFPIVHNLRNLRVLHLAKNFIAEIPSDGLNNCNELMKLDLSNNFLGAFALETDDLYYMENLNIDNNIISCDCNLLKYYSKFEPAYIPIWLDYAFQTAYCQGTRRFANKTLIDALTYYYFDMVCTHETPPNVLMVLIGSWLSLLLAVVCYVWIKTMCSARRKRQSWRSEQYQGKGQRKRKSVSIRDGELIERSPSKLEETGPIWEKENLLSTQEGEISNEEFDLKISEAKWRSMTETFV